MRQTASHDKHSQAQNGVAMLSPPGSISRSRLISRCRNRSRTSLALSPSTPAGRPTAPFGKAFGELFVGPPCALRASRNLAASSYRSSCIARFSCASTLLASAGKKDPPEAGSEHMFVHMFVRLVYRAEEARITDESRGATHERYGVAMRRGVAVRLRATCDFALLGALTCFRSALLSSHQSAEMCMVAYMTHRHCNTQTLGQRERERERERQAQI